jgi:hypothetical protein
MFEEIDDIQVWNVLAIRQSTSGIHLSLQRVHLPLQVFS